MPQASPSRAIPHLIGGVRRAIGKAADKLREAPDAGTCAAESSFFEPSEPAPSAARDPGRKKLQSPGRLASFDLPKFTENNLPRLASSITSGAASKAATARTVQKGLGYATAKRK